MKKFVSGLVLAVVCGSAVAEFERPHHGRGPVGSYAGTCVGYYAGNTSAPCAQNLFIASNNAVSSSGCISQTVFSGLYYGPQQQLELRAPGWAAQPAGQTLTLTLQRQGHRWVASGSGYGISDRKWTYSCSFNQQ